MNYLQKVKSERDELKAELERVKAERDSALESADIQCNIRYMQTEELESIKSRLPVNRDGDVVLWGDEQWACEYQVFGFQFTAIRETDKGFELKEKGGHNWWPVEACHSSAESCRAAHEGKEGDGS